MKALNNKRGQQNELLLSPLRSLKLLYAVISIGYPCGDGL